MDDTTSVLFGLDDHRVLDVVRVDDRVMRVVIETIDREGACPACGVLSARVKDRPLVRLRDLPASGQRVELWCRRRPAGVSGAGLPPVVVHPGQRPGPSRPGSRPGYAGGWRRPSPARTAPTPTSPASRRCPGTPHKTRWSPRRLGGYPRGHRPACSGSTRPAP